LVWERFGADVRNYVEPFFGSGAVLLRRPGFDAQRAPIETINDLDCLVGNFWRAVQVDPEAVAYWADSPVNEADLHARHRWLHRAVREAWAEMGGIAAWRERLTHDPEFCDVRIAGWWCWGLSCWIGDNWCRIEEGAAAGRGVHSAAGGQSGRGMERMPELKRDRGLHQAAEDYRTDAKRPVLAYNVGRGVHSDAVPSKTLLGGGRIGKGVHSGGLAKDGTQTEVYSRDRPADVCWEQKPSLSKGGEGIHRPRLEIFTWLQALSTRLRRVRVCCGDWSRICGPSPTFKIGMTAVFLDPPYGASDRDKVYSTDSLAVASEVRAWCLSNGANPKLRIALCGYAGEGHEVLEDQGWSVVHWKAAGGYAARNKTNQNAGRERIWFSPACLDPRPTLF
jgi:hypothetical protein